MHTSIFLCFIWSWPCRNPYCVSLLTGMAVCSSKQGQTKINASRGKQQKYRQVRDKKKWGWGEKIKRSQVGKNKFERKLFLSLNTHKKTISCVTFCRLRGGQEHKSNLSCNSHPALRRRGQQCHSAQQLPAVQQGKLYCIGFWPINTHRHTIIFLTFLLLFINFLRFLTLHLWLTLNGTLLTITLTKIFTPHL